jgi:hypothetical protein
MNIVGMVGYLVFVSYLAIVNHNYFVKRKRLIFLAIPLMLSLPIIMLALRQKNQVAWISSANLQSDYISRLLYWPFLESERTLKGFALVFALSVTLVAYVKGYQYLSTRMTPFQFLVLGLTTLPPLALLIFSTIQPLFITRYFAYSAIGVSIVWSQIVLSLKNRLIQFSVLLIFVMICSFNIKLITLERDGKSDWDQIFREVRNGPINALVVIEPSWSSPLARYYFKDDPKYTILGGINQLKVKATSDCTHLPKYIWVVSMFTAIEKKQISDLASIGYVINSPNRIGEVQFLKSKNCK